jgi:hypothetical protein
VIAAAGVVLACLSGCSSTNRVVGERPALTTSTPTPVPTAFSTAVPEQDAALPAATKPVDPPVRVQVAWADTDVPVAAVGVDRTGALELPADPATAGWYRFGAAPSSDAGTTVIAAHVDAVGYGVGPFAHLVDVPDGTTITVTGGSGAVSQFRVTSVSLVRKTSIPWADVFTTTGPRRLVLVTCGGDFDYTTHHYLSNLLITAVPR